MIALPAGGNSTPLGLGKCAGGGESRWSGARRIKASEGLRDNGTLWAPVNKIRPRAIQFVNARKKRELET